MFFPILQSDGSVAQRQPIEDHWYCGFVFDENYVDVGGYRDDLIACYTGNGVFVDENDDEVDMTFYDFIVEQN